MFVVLEELADHGLRHPVHQEQVGLAGVGAQHLEAQAVDLDRFTALGHAAETVGDDAADRVELVVREARREGFVELG